jgi:ketosteroid isomerase-like protein
MKNKFTKGIALSIFAVVMMACQPKKEEAASETAMAADTEQIKKELQTMEDAYAVAMNTGNVDVLEYYAEDAVTYSQNELPKVGRAAIMADLKTSAEKAKAEGMTVKYVTTEVHPSADGNQVVEIGTYRSSDSTNTKVRSGHYMAVYKKVDGKYVCVRDMGSSDQPKIE